MTSREIIIRINKELRYGDKADIARRSGLSKYTVNRFFNGKEDELIEDTHNKITNEALRLIDERQKREKATAKKTNTLLP